MKQTMLFKVQDTSTPGSHKFSKCERALYHPILKTQKLLEYTVRGNHKMVTKMLEQDIDLIYKKGMVKDLSGKTFENISCFEYTLWALDKHMWMAMLECLPKNIKGQKILEHLSSQYNTVNKTGVQYWYQGNQFVAHHFDFENTIIKELQKLFDLLSQIKDWATEEQAVAINEQFIKGKGAAQKQLPMHVIFEYCSRKPFYAEPLFTTRPVSSSMVYNIFTHQKTPWFSLNSGLGIHYAIIKSDDGARIWNQGGQTYLDAGILKLELDGMRNLFAIRTQDFINLQSFLQTLKNACVSNSEIQPLSTRVYAAKEFNQEYEEIYCGCVLS